MSGLDYYHGAAAQEHISNHILHSEMRKAAAQRDELIRQRDEAMAMLGMSTDVSNSLIKKKKALEEDLDRVTEENRRLTETLRLRDNEKADISSLLKRIEGSLRDSRIKLANAYTAHNGVIDA